MQKVAAKYHDDKRLFENIFSRFSVRVEGRDIFLPRDIKELTIKEFGAAFKMSARAINIMQIKAGGPNGSVIDVAQLREYDLLSMQNVGQKTVDEITYGLNELRQIYKRPRELTGKLVKTRTPFDLAKTEEQEIFYAINLLRKKDYLVVPPKDMIRFLRDHCNWQIRKDA